MKTNAKYSHFVPMNPSQNAWNLRAVDVWFCAVHWAFVESSPWMMDETDMVLIGSLSHWRGWTRPYRSNTMITYKGCSHGCLSCQPVDSRRIRVKSLQVGMPWCSVKVPPLLPIAMAVWGLVWEIKDDIWLLSGVDCLTRTPFPYGPSCS